MADYCRLMRLATTAAPKPLSIFTTVTLDAQLLSMPKKGGNAVEAGAISNAGRDGNDGDGDQPADHAGQSAFHTGDNNQHASAVQLFAPIEQPVKTSDADVVKRFDFVAHDLQSNERLFSHRNVRRAGRDDQDSSFALNRVIF